MVLKVLATRPVRPILTLDLLLPLLRNINELYPASIKLNLDEWPSIKKFKKRARTALTSVLLSRCEYRSISNCLLINLLPSQAIQLVEMDHNPQALSDLRMKIAIDLSGRRRREIDRRLARNGEWKLFVQIFLFSCDFCRADVALRIQTQTKLEYLPLDILGTSKNRSNLNFIAIAILKKEIYETRNGKFLSFETFQILHELTIWRLG